MQLVVQALVESRKRKAGKESEHKTKASLATKEVVEHYHFEVEHTIRDSMAILEEEVQIV
jgi:hypothetical protein